MTTTKQPVGRPITKARPVKPDWLESQVLPGDSIGEASKRAVRLANARHSRVRFVYQGLTIEAEEDGDAMDCVNFWLKNRVKSKLAPR
jgi:hypothetical protein